MLTAPGCNIIRAYDINVKKKYIYIYTNTFYEKENVSLKFYDDVVDEVGNKSDGKGEGGDQSQHVIWAKGLLAHVLIYWLSIKLIDTFSVW